MNEAEVFTATYFDTCVIERISDIENVESGITEQVYFPIHDASYPVLFSRKMGNLPVIENKEAFKFNISYEEQKNFFRTLI
ncbi:hypothetical protein NWO28_06705 [Enterococcus faecalis]|nr:hypothetical protein [Enterococcus faecalis]